MQIVNVTKSVYLSRKRKTQTTNCYYLLLSLNRLIEVAPPACHASACRFILYYRSMCANSIRGDAFGFFYSFDLCMQMLYQRQTTAQKWQCMQHKNWFQFGLALIEFNARGARCVMVHAMSSQAWWWPTHSLFLWSSSSLSCALCIKSNRVNDIAAHDCI